MTLDELFEKVNEKARGYVPKGNEPDARILLDIEGPDARKWLAEFANGKGGLAVYDGGGAPPDLTVTVSGDTLIGVATKKVSAAMAFMTGKIKIAGDMDLLGVLGNLWPEQQ